MLTPDAMLHCIQCTHPENYYCRYRAIRQYAPEDGDNGTTLRLITWCSKWRVNRDKTVTIMGCEPYYNSTLELR